MKWRSLVLLAALIAITLSGTAVPAATAADSPPTAKSKSGTRFQNADLARVARAWERLVGGTVTVSERARTRRVSCEISAPSKSELRKAFVAALRENGIYVIERTDGVIFDTEPEAKQAK